MYLHLNTGGKFVLASASTRGTQQKTAGAGNAATAGAIAAELISADAFIANGGQKEGVGASPATSDSAAATDTATADHTKAISVAARTESSRS